MKKWFLYSPEFRGNFQFFPPKHMCFQFFETAHKRQIYSSVEFPLDFLPAANLDMLFQSQ